MQDFAEGTGLSRDKLGERANTFVKVLTKVVGFSKNGRSGEYVGIKEHTPHVW